MDLSGQIPFAIRRQDEKIVSIDDVLSGLACDCICPACQAVLVAKKGPVNAHHFSHHDKSAELCQFSAFTSIRLMLLEIFGSGLCSQQSAINLPIKKIEITLYSESGKLFHDSANLTKPCPPVFGSLHDRYKPPQIRLTFAPISPQEEPDVCLAVHLPPANPEQNLLEWLDEYTNQWPKRGVLDVNYGVILSMLWSKTEFPEELPITDRLLKIFFTKPYIFNWLYHPSEKLEQEKLTAKLKKTKDAWEYQQAQKEIIRKSIIIEDNNRLELMAKQAPSFYELYEDPSLKRKNQPFPVEEPGMSIEDVIEYIHANGIKPDSVDSIYPILELEVNNGWIVVETDKIWFISAIKPADWKMANLRYAAGMRKGLCVDRTQELSKALKV